MSVNENIIAVSKSNHQNYSFKMIVNHQSDFEPYKSVSFCPIYFSEINHVACNYPLSLLSILKMNFIL